ncbi:MAG TPA: hypothetical protein VMR18_00640 [Candidatus Saccharimonadales bacterium]|jgi:hypothetical protein|nr:hypothetical protein [Candidatus Saccharimonadales bacterium]
MNTASGVLLIVVSSVLSVFLIVGIIVLVKVIQLINSLKRISQKAEKVIDSAEAVSNIFRKSAGPLAIGRFLNNIMDAVAKHKKG